MRRAALAKSALNIMCIFLACSCMLVAQQLPSTTELSLPGRPLVLKVNLDDLQVTHRAACFPPAQKLPAAPALSY